MDLGIEAGKMNDETPHCVFFSAKQLKRPELIEFCSSRSKTRATKKGLQHISHGLKFDISIVCWELLR